MEELSCKIDGVVYSDRNTGFFILKVRPGNGGTATVKGNFPGVNMVPGLKAKFRGEWINNPKYGRQLNASSCEVVPDKGRIGIISYLTSNVPSIGPITAGKLYGAFGDDLVTILENEPDRIAECDFLTSVQAKAVIDEWKKSSEVRTVSIFLTDIGLNAFQVRSVYKAYGVLASQLVRENPYCLYDCAGVGFQTADTAARKIGVGPDDPRRVRAMVMFIMESLSFTEGHMWVSSDDIRAFVRKMFRKYSLEPFSHGDYLSDSHYFSALQELKSSGEVVALDDRLYLAVNWKHELDAAKAVAAVASRPPYEFGDLSSILKKFESGNDISLSDEQSQAFLSLAKSRICVISGYPGTGKTTLISAFVHLFEQANLHYVLMSPTGIAAKRLSQVTGKVASTIHRSLGYSWDGEWDFHSSNKFVADAVIVDEMSMVDASTFYHLITALPQDAVIVLVGDSAQLPSVGAGYVLNNLLGCPEVPHVSLTRIYRQEKQSDIVKVAHAILSGENIDTSFRKDSQFVFLPFDRDQVLDEIRNVTIMMKDRGTNFQVIAPMYDGDLGVNNLNRKLREVLNPDFASGKASKLKHGPCDLYEGDRVMVVKNDYNRMVFNGDVGKVQRISIKNDEVEVKIFGWFDHESPVPRYVDKVFSFKLEEARHVLRVAYACTTHKVQGQEFDYVILPMTMQYGIMLYRNLIYTAITRAKKKAFVFGDPKAFQFSVSNDRETVRNSSLGDLIRASCSDFEDPPVSGVSGPKENHDVEDATSN